MQLGEGRTLERAKTRGHPSNASGECQERIGGFLARYSQGYTRRLSLCQHYAPQLRAREFSLDPFKERESGAESMLDRTP